METNKNKKGFISLVAILIIVSLTIWYMVIVLDSQYKSSKKSSGELNSEAPNINNAVQKTKNLKDALESTNDLLDQEYEGL